MTDASENAKKAAHAASVNAKNAAKAVSAHSPATVETVETAEAVAQPKLSREELQQNTARARAELAAALDAIEDKLNVPKRIGQATERGTERVRALAADNPVALGAIALGAAAVVGVGVWALVRAFTR